MKYLKQRRGRDMRWRESKTRRERLKVAALIGGSEHSGALISDEGFELEVRGE